MRHQLSDHKCEKTECSYSGKKLIEKRLFPEVKMEDHQSDPFDVTFTVTPEEKNRYDNIFDSLGPRVGLLSKKNVMMVLNLWKLPVASLDKIWELSDQDSDGFLDRYEWTVANHLTVRVCKGAPIPNQVNTSNHDDL